VERRDESTDAELRARARGIVDANLYMTLATADGEGHPWASPVWYAHEDYREFLWVSRPDARHSRNLSERPEVGIVIFDSTVAVGGAEAVYVEAVAEELASAEREHGIELYSRRSEAAGAGRWGLADVTSPAPHRLYRARASAHFILAANDQRASVEP
jgi:uncharacterized protein YhbP (UPF0306 family)